jgi:acetylornithine aminotransferase/acetylornithine/N-succinyldiaminopimelate aminotransferase
VNLEQVSKLESKLLVATYDRYPVLLHKGRGVYLYDNKGRKYLDLLSGIGVNALGYAHPALTKTIAKQAKLLVHTSNLFYHEYQGRLAAALTKILAWTGFFTNTAQRWKRAEAAHNIKPIARKVKGKWRILAMEHAFHGSTFGTLATTHK